MSKTFRRKGSEYEYEYYWVLRDWKMVDGFWRTVFIDRESKDGRKRVARFHSDNQYTMRMCPAWFRRGLNRKLRANQNQSVRVFARFGDLEDGPNYIRPFVHDALYLWW